MNTPSSGNHGATNPYGLPQGALGSADTEVEAQRPSRPYFTHITLHGCNLLGLANVFAFIGGLTLSTTLIAALPPWPANRALGLAVLALFGLVVCRPCVFDFVLRIRTGSGGRLMRLLSPHAGGALFYIPVWAVYPATAIFCTVMVLRGK